MRAPEMQIASMDLRVIGIDRTVCAQFVFFVFARSILVPQSLHCDRVRSSSTGHRPRIGRTADRCSAEQGALHVHRARRLHASGCPNRHRIHRRHPWRRPSTSDAQIARACNERPLLARRELSGRVAAGYVRLASMQSGSRCAH